MDWGYFLARNTDGTVRLIVRRDGPDIQLLTPDGWVERPQLLPRFHDGFLDEASLDDAREAASAKGLPLAPLSA